MFDMLEDTRSRLEKNNGNIRQIADTCRTDEGQRLYSYDSILRIMHGKHQPRYDRLKLLWQHLVTFDARGGK